MAFEAAERMDERDEGRIDGRGDRGRCHSSTSGLDRHAADLIAKSNNEIGKPNINHFEKVISTS